MQWLQVPSSPPSPSAPHQLSHRLQGQLGAVFVKPCSFRQQLLAAPGDFLSLICFPRGLERASRLEGVKTGMQSAALCLPHPLSSLPSINTSQIAPFKCITSQSRHSLNCNGFGSPWSSISSMVCSNVGNKPLSWSSSFICSSGGSPGCMPHPVQGVETSAQTWRGLNLAPKPQCWRPNCHPYYPSHPYHQTSLSHHPRQPGYVLHHPSYPHPHPNCPHHSSHMHRQSQPIIPDIPIIIPVISISHSSLTLLCPHLPYPAWGWVTALALVSPTPGTSGRGLGSAYLAQPGTSGRPWNE